VASLIIKVTKDGSSREYLFNKLGPILIGTEENSDIRIQDDQLEGKILEVKLSSDNIFIKELALKAEVFLDTVILPYREETPYKQGQTISLAQSHYQIQVFKGGEEALEPPPFFTDEFKLQLEELKRKIKDKEDQLRLAERQLEKKRSSIEDVDAGIRVQLNEKNKRELEIDFLKKRQYEINQELDKKRDQINQEQNALNVLKEHVSKLNHEDQALSENILRHESTLFRMKGDIERSHLEIKDFRQKLAGLELEEKKKTNSLIDLKRESDEVSQQTVVETQRLNVLLAQTDQSQREKRKIEVKIEILKKEIDDNSRTLDQIQSLMDDQQKLKRESEAKLQTLGFEIERSEHLIIKIREDVLLEQGREKQLKNLNEELRADLSKIEEKLVSKKNQFNQLDYQTQDSLKNLSNLKIEIEKSNYHLDELLIEEKAQDLKMLGLRKELELFNKKIEHDKKNHLEHFEETKMRREFELKTIFKEIDEHKFELALLQSAVKEIQTQHADFVAVNQVLFKERSEIEAKVEALSHRRMELDKVGSKIKEENTSLFLEKGRLENELSILKFKLMDCESIIKQKESESFLEIENLKREERSRLHTERIVMLSEVEAQKQKSMMEVDASFKVKQEHLDALKEEKFKDVDRILKDAQEEASRLLAVARQEEHQLVQAASKRLTAATSESILREQKSHERIKDAQSYFHEKEKEAEILILNSRKMAAEIFRKSEIDLQEDLDKRKKKIKNYLTQKQERSDQYFIALKKTQTLKLKKDHDYEVKKLDDLKRRELKKVAKIKNEALDASSAVKAQLLKEVREGNLEAKAAIAAQRKRQEEELSETKKTVLEHINQIKHRQSESLREELSREKELFEQSKRQRVQMATQGVVNLLISKLGSLPQETLREDIEATLMMTINGHNSDNHKKMEQILDYNPMKQKKIMPVLKKYSIRFGIPAAIVLTLMGDIGSSRTALVNLSAQIIKQNHSASDLFVKQQQKEWKEKYTFKNDMTTGFKDSITDNILYTTDYQKIMESEVFQNQWILALNDFMVKELELSEDVAINYISSEGSLVKDLWAVRKEIHPKYKEQGFKKMRDLEVANLGWLNEKIPDSEKMNKFKDFRSTYFNNYFNSLSNEKRSLASDEGNL
jgi:hypothetical protein